MSTLAALHLQPDVPQVLGVIGAGPIARAHILLMMEHLAVERVLVCDQVDDRARALVREIRDVARPPTSRTSPIPRRWCGRPTSWSPPRRPPAPTSATTGCKPGSLVVNVSLDDVDEETYLRADRLYVDDWDLVVADTQRLLGKLARAGKIAGAGPATAAAAPVDGTLGQLVTGTCPGRDDDRQIVVVNPFGMAIERPGHRQPRLRGRPAPQLRHCSSTRDRRDGQAARNLISVEDLTTDDLRQLVTRGRDYAERTVAIDGRSCRGGWWPSTSARPRPGPAPPSPSAALRLGAQILTYGPHDLQTNTGETYRDTGRVLATMVDAVVARTAGDPQELRDLAEQGTMPVVNAMTADEHPTQAIADLATLLQHFGRIENLRVLYVGEGNNSASALALALARFPGNELYLRTPAGYGLADDKLDLARRQAARQRELRRGGPRHVGPAGRGRRRLHHPLADHRHHQARPRLARAVRALPGERSSSWPAGRTPGSCTTCPPTGVRRSPPRCSTAPPASPSRQAANKYHTALAILEWCLAGQVGHVDRRRRRTVVRLPPPHARRPAPARRGRASSSTRPTPRSACGPRSTSSDRDRPSSTSDRGAARRPRPSPGPARGTCTASTCRSRASPGPPSTTGSRTAPGGSPSGSPTTRS